MRQRIVPHPNKGFADPVGVYWSPNSIDRATATRSTARSAYCDPVVARRNLRLLTNIHVDKVIVEKNTFASLIATGVKFTSRHSKKQALAFARKEVILTAGGVFTPHLLMYSGIGHKDVLGAAGVAVKKVGFQVA